MLGRESLIGNLVMAIKEHSRSFGIAGAVAGAVLVIYYCGSIKHYPTGMTIADTLFFLWAVLVFGFYYSAVVFAFFVASLFWVTILAKPLNYLAKKKSKNDFVIPAPKTDWFMVVFGGFLSNLIIFGISIYKQHPVEAIFAAIVLIGFIYVLIDNVAKRNVSDHHLVDSNGDQLKVNAIKPDVLKFVFYALLYAVPILFGQVGGGVARTTFETMGVRQVGVDVAIESKNYKWILERYKDNGYLKQVECEEVCILESVNILFTNIGNNTKLNMKGSSGIAEIVIPTSSIAAISKFRPNKSIQPTAKASDD